MLRFLVSLIILSGFFLDSKAVTSFVNPGKVDTTSLHLVRPFRIVIDPGHGGRDSATRAKGFYEKDIVLNISMEVKLGLEKHGYEVVMTRETDEFISLAERALFKGDIFISLHANTVADTIGESVRSMIKGIEIYTTKSLHQGEEQKEKSRTLAITFQKELSRLSGITMRGIKEKSLAVLDKNTSPAILIELGFISNQEDLEFLTNRRNYTLISDAFVKAIKQYLINTNQKN